MEWLVQVSRQAINSFLWRCHLKNNGPLPLVSRPKSRNLPSCTPMLGSLEQRWSSHFLRVLQSIARSALHSSAHVNTYGLFRLARRLFMQSGIIALPLDKSPGYAIIDPHVFPAVEALAVSSEHYRPTVAQDVFRLAAAYRDLAKSVGNLYGEEGRTLALNISASFDPKFVATPIAILVKSHKPEGEVGVRTIHRGFKQCFHGLSMWVHRVLQPLVDALPWIARDSHQVRAGLLEAAIDADATVTIEDLKDFYLTGESLDIAVHVGKLVDPTVRAVMIAALQFLLDNQFVQTSCASHLHKVVSGSGIGLLHSANVATLFYFSKVESQLSPLSNTVKCFRYHDDIICVHSSRANMRAYHAQKRLLHGQIFKSKLQVYSVGTRCPFLDLDIGVFSPRLCIVASQTKPVTPLCPTSCHNFDVHKSWPAAVATRVYKLSGSSGDLALESLRSRYIHANTHPFTLAVFKLCTSSLCLPWRPRGIGGRQASNCSRVPCVLRYHPVFKLAFQRALRLVPVPEILGLRIVAAWRNSLPSVSGFINHTNRRHFSCMVSG